MTYTPSVRRPRAARIAATANCKARFNGARSSESAADQASSTDGPPKPLSKRALFRTQMCSHVWTDTDGSLINDCPFGRKCQFAHAPSELRTRVFGDHYKTRLCADYHQRNYCPYGRRCKYRHAERTDTDGDVPIVRVRAPPTDVDGWVALLDASTDGAAPALGWLLGGGRLCMQSTG